MCAIRLTNAARIQTLVSSVLLLAVSGSETIEPVFPVENDARIAAINEQYVFADMHSHPSRLHRADVEALRRKR